MKISKAEHDGVITVMTLTELCHFCSADTQWVVELIEHGIVEPMNGPQADYAFEAPSVLRAKKARRLERDLGINMAGIALVLDLLEERDRLRRELGRFETL